MTLRRCALLSMDDLSGFYTYEQATFPHFEASGWTAEEVSWRADADWSAYDLVVIRTPWDYQAEAEAFLATLERISSVTLLENEVAICRWNLAKTYLQDLEAAGVPIVPTDWNQAGQGLDEAVYDRLGCAEIVVKPVISANADYTYRIARDAFHDHAEVLSRDFAERAYMVQPFLAEVVREGELSLFYFAGAYSHAVLKTPAEEDFRVQEEHGGTIRAVSPEPAALAAGDRVLAATPGDPLYARVDLVREGGGWLLMELELIEPSLYFPYDEGSPRRFVGACIERWRARA